MTLVSKSLIPVLLLLGACAGKPEVITREVPVTVHVPVSVPCMRERPVEPEPLRDRVSREEWEAMTTDQREALVGAQALARKTYGDRLTVASAGCN